jgi:hypothetical protein
MHALCMCFVQKVKVVSAVSSYLYMYIAGEASKVVNVVCMNSGLNLQCVALSPYRPTPALRIKLVTVDYRFTM